MIAAGPLTADATGGVDAMGLLFAADTMTMREAFLVLLVVVPGCSDDSSRLSVEEATRCARERFVQRGGTFEAMGDAAAYSYESSNGFAKVVVTFDASRRPVSTFFASSPHGSHQQLMEAAQIVKDCAAYGGRREE
jgi:hypothetical protein